MTPVPDRFDVIGEELACAYHTARCPDRRTLARQIAAVLRQAADEALDAVEAEFRGWSETTYDARDMFQVLADVRAALASPAAAPAPPPAKEPEQRRVTCVECQGRGHIYGDKCRNCGGYGYEMVPVDTHPAAAPAAEEHGVFRDSTGRRVYPEHAPPSEPVAPERLKRDAALIGKLTHPAPPEPDTGPDPDVEPVAPSLLPRVLAALEESAWESDQILAAELRRYIAEMEDVASARWRYAAMAAHPLDPLVRVIVEPCEVGGHYRNENGVTFHPSKCVGK